MSSLRTRIAALGAAVAAVGLAGPEAAAQGESGLIQIELELPDRDENHEDANAYSEITNEVRIQEYFNLARCECGQNFGLKLQVLDSASAPQRPVQLFFGNTCDDIELRPLCANLGAVFDDASTDLRNPQTLLLAMDEFVNFDEQLPDGMCPDSEVTRNAYFMVDADGNETEFEYIDIFDQFLDLNPPPEPNTIVARASEESINVDWELSESRIDDFRIFQILCAEVTGPDTIEPVFSNPDDPEYDTSFSVCGQASATTRFVPHHGGGGGGLDAGVDAAGPDAGGPSLPPGLAELDEAFICGTGTSLTDLRVTGLQNGVDYRVVWLGIDQARNATAVDLGVVTPGPLIDFWEDYKNQGGGAQGGYCFVATAAYGDYDHPMVVVLRDFRDNTLARFGLGRWLIRTYYDLSPGLAGFIRDNAVARFVAKVLLYPLVVAAGLWEYTNWLGKLALLFAFVLYRRLRRRRRETDVEAEPAEPRRRPSRHRAAVAAAAGALVLLVANAASAQTWPSGFEELEEDIPTDPKPSDVKWNFELKFGPYVPDVNSEFSGTGPFERVFGDGPMLMSHVALDRFFLWPRGGQLGASVGLGFLTTAASVFADEDEDGVADMDADGNPIRVGGESTKFRLLPLSAQAVYRFTALDEQLNVPIVPYGKAGFSYYLWWVTRPDGSTASACENAGDDPATCDRTDGRGGSLGFQATIGLALRAERIDRDAGLHLRNELGIEHAGVFAELTYARVDGFGADTKLAVGDLTWFAGVNFEF